MGAMGAQGAVRQIVGLGNPGPEYAATRHNLGFRVVERLAQRLAPGQPASERCAAEVVDVPARGLVLARPQTYMNRSGYAVACLCEAHGIDPGSILVVYDDLHLPLGRLRLRSSGSPAGHRGMESIVEALSTTAVPRLRLGIGVEALGDLPGFVLSPFAAGEEDAAAQLVERAAEAALCWLEEGIGEAMARYNAASADV